MQLLFYATESPFTHQCFSTQRYCYVLTHKLKTINEVTPHAKMTQDENIFKLWVTQSESNSVDFHRNAPFD